MEKFDFRKPVHAEIQFEESDEDIVSPGEELVENCKTLNETRPIVSSTLTINKCSDKNPNLHKHKSTKKRSPLKRKLPNESKDIHKNVKLPNSNAIEKYISDIELRSTSVQKSLPKLNTSNEYETSHVSTKSMNVQSYVKIYRDLIYCVCKNLVAIMKSIKQLQTNITITDTMSLQDCIKNRKKYYFVLSYTTVTTIFVPRKDNIEFQNYVINTALEIAEANNIKCEYKDVEPLYNDLLNWAELQRKHIEVNDFTNAVNDPYELTENCHQKEIGISRSNENFLSSFNYTRKDNVSNLSPIHPDMWSYNTYLQSTQNALPRLNKLSAPKSKTRNSKRKINTIDKQTPQLNQTGQNFNCDANDTENSRAKIRAPCVQIEVVNKDHGNQQNSNDYLINQTAPAQYPYYTQGSLNTSQDKSSYLQNALSTQLIPNVTQSNYEVRISSNLNQSQMVRAPPPYPASSTFMSNNQLQRQLNVEQKIDGNYTQKEYQSRSPYYSQSSNGSTHLSALEQILNSRNMAPNVSNLSNEKVNAALQNFMPSTYNKQNCMPPTYSQTWNIHDRDNFSVSNENVNTPRNYNDYPMSSNNFKPSETQTEYRFQRERLDVTQLIDRSDNACVPRTNYSHMFQESGTDKQQDARKSLSRDSGFMSPVNFNLMGDESLKTSEDIRKTAENMPVISHITSLNPSAVLQNLGNCVGCGTMTRNKCVRCCVNYYCSYECHVRDWKQHNLFCTQWASMRSSVNNM